MKKEKLLQKKRAFALHHTSYFFTFGFYSSLLLIILSCLLLNNRTTNSNRKQIQSIISLAPIKDIRSSNTSNCSDNERLIFNFQMPGFSKNSCYRENKKNGNIELQGGWFKCKSIFYKNFESFEETNTKNIFNLGKQYFCGEIYDLQTDEFEYLDQLNTEEVQKGSYINFQ